ncbi:MAG: hypothetical protein WAV32_00940 [Halobacteriota archaeon]
MAVLDLRGIICDKTKEAVDEPFLEVFVDRGEHSSDRWSWGPVSMNDGDARSINWSRIFHERIRIELWEWDRRGSDHIGDLELTATDEWGSEQEHRIAARRAEYRLIYAVNPRRDERFVLNLVSLDCNDAQERTDEPYLVVNGVTVWGPASMRTGESRRIEGEEPIYFSGGGNAIVELWERDPARSERIGDPMRIDERLARIMAENPRENHRHRFLGDRGIPGDATYTLTYRVSRVEVPPG